MNGYKAFYKGRQLEVEANTSYEAQKKAAEVLKVKEKYRYRVTVALCEVDGKQVVHIPDF